MGLIEIKCPKSKQFMSPEELLKDENFYMCSLNGFPELKKDHSHGYYSQIQMDYHFVTLLSTRSKE